MLLHEVYEELDNIIKETYLLFSKYHLKSTLEVCSCCVFEKDVQELMATPLNAISKDLLYKSYYESAQSGTEQELREIKHFLPRVLELVEANEFPCHSDEIVFGRFDLRDVLLWEKEELALLQKFALFYVKRLFIQNDFNLCMADVLVMFGYGNFDLLPLLEEWKNTNNKESFSQLYYLVTSEIKHKHGEYYKLTNGFATKETSEAVIRWLEADETIKTFSLQIEELLLDEESTLDDEDWLELDIVYGYLNKKALWYQ